MSRRGRDSLTVGGSVRSSSFDVVCAGEALVDFTGRSTAPAASAPRFRPSGGAVNAALALAQSGLRVGLAAALPDDSIGRALVARVAAAGIDTAGVSLAPPRPGLLVVEASGGARRVIAHRAEDELVLAVPVEWTPRVLLLSGLSPSLPHAAELCRAARAARRAGSLVVVDINARGHAWAGRDPRSIRALLREADVVRCSTSDLAALWSDPVTMRATTPPNAVLVVTQGAGPARAMGPFGEVIEAPRQVAAAAPAGAGDVFTAAICAELLRRDDRWAERADLWERALQRGHAATAARLSRR